MTIGTSNEKDILTTMFFYGTIVVTMFWGKTMILHICIFKLSDCLFFSTDTLSMQIGCIVHCIYSQSYVYDKINIVLLHAQQKQIDNITVNSPLLVY